MRLLCHHAHWIATLRNSLPEVMTTGRSVKLIAPIVWRSAKVGVRPLPLNKLVDNFEAQYEYVANEGSLFTFKTNLRAPRYRSAPAHHTLVHACISSSHLIFGTGYRLVTSD